MSRLSLNNLIDLYDLFCLFSASTTVKKVLQAFCFHIFCASVHLLVCTYVHLSECYSFSMRWIRRTNCGAIAMMFVRPSVCLSEMGMCCDHTVHFSADLSIQLDSPMFWAPRHQSMSTYSQPSFSSFTRNRVGVWMCKLGLDVNAGNDK